MYWRLGIARTLYQNPCVTFPICVCHSQLHIEGRGSRCWWRTPGWRSWGQSTACCVAWLNAHWAGLDLSINQRPPGSLDISCSCLLPYLLHLYPRSLLPIKHRKSLEIQLLQVAWLLCALWCLSMQAKGFWKQDPEANIWMRMGSGEGFAMRNFIICTVHLI